MADYIPITDNELLPDQPIPSLLGLRWRDNPLAIAEGAKEAPRISPKAMSSNLLGYFGTSTGRVGVSDVGWVKVLKIKLWSRHGGGNRPFSISFSNNNGQSWQADHLINNGAITDSALIGGEVEVSLLTGQYSGLLPKYNTSSPYLNTVKSEGVVPGVAPNINAVRVYMAGSPFEVAFWAVGGREDV